MMRIGVNGIGIQRGAGLGGNAMRPFYGLDFDGGDYVFADGVAAILGTHPTGTVAWWCDVDASNQGVVMSISSGDAVPALTVFVVQFFENKLNIALVVDGTLKWQWVSTSTITGDSRHHFAIAHNGTEISIFMDGVALPGSFTDDTDKTLWWKTICADATSDADRMVLGAHYFSSTFQLFYTNMVTQVVFTSNVWDAADALAASRDPNVDDADLLYYQMQPGTGTVLNDNAGNLALDFGLTTAAPQWTVSDFKLPPTRF